MTTPVTVQLDIPADLKHLGIITACIAEVVLAQSDLPDAELVSHNVQLAVHEICTNIVQHAYGDQPGGRIRATVALHLEPRRITVDLSDTGRNTFDPAAVAAPSLEEAQVHGYGLFLARQLMDTLTYELQPGNNHWHLDKQL